MNPVAPARHVELLRQRLEAEHFVDFKRGSRVEFEDCPRCDPAKPGKIKKPGRHAIERVVWIECPTCRGNEVRLRVEGPWGGVSRFLWPDELPAAYLLATFGPPRKQQPKGDPAEYGDDPPW